MDKGGSWRGEHQMRAPRRMIQQFSQQIVNRRIMNDVIVVQHQEEWLVNLVVSLLKLLTITGKGGTLTALSSACVSGPNSGYKV
jgi:hypothetical protein